ncbi:MAG TPA: hypothetical protein V6D17_10700 [Candidatus Obscuribacterales bacterium]
MSFKISGAGAWVLLSAFLFLSGVPSLALESDQILDKAEKVIFGRANSGEPMDIRLKRLEKRIFGKKKGGDESERIERIAHVLLLNRDETATSSSGSHKADVSGPTSSAAQQAPHQERADSPQTQLSRTNSLTPGQTRLGTEPAEFPQGAPSGMNSLVPEQSTVGLEPANAPPTAASGANSRAPGKTTSLSGSYQEPLSGSESPASRCLGVSRSSDKAVTAKPPSEPGHPVSTKSSTASAKKTQPWPVVRENVGGAKTAVKAKSTAGTSLTSAKLIELKPLTPVVAKEVPGSVRELIKAGMEAHSRGNDAEAEQLFRKAVLADPHNPDGFFNLGALSERRRDYIGALVNYRAALNLMPDDKETIEAVQAVEAIIKERTAGTSATFSESADNRGYAGVASGADKSGHAGAALPQGSENGLGSHAASSGPPAAPDFRAKAPIAAPDGPLTVRQPLIPENNVRASAQPYHDANEPQSEPFQLHTARNRAMTSANQTNIPMRNVSPSNIPTRNVSSNTAKAVFGVALRFGASQALRASGLHCPLCRFNLLRGPLRGL